MADILSQIMQHNSGLPADLRKAADTILNSGDHLLKLINEVGQLGLSPRCLRADGPTVGWDCRPAMG